MEDFKTVTSNRKSETVDTLISTALQSVAFFHHRHLTTTDYELHKSLDEYYKNAPEHIDAITESYIGSGGVVSTELVFKQPTPNLDSTTHLRNLKRIAIAANKSMISKDEYGVINNIEGFIAFIDSIIYKLRLK